LILGIFARPDVDIVIADPPHWHGLMSIMAAKQGKDFGARTHEQTIGEGKKVVEAMQQHGKMFR